MSEPTPPNAAVDLVLHEINALATEIIKAALSCEAALGYMPGKVIAATGSGPMIKEGQRPVFCVVSVITAPMGQSDLNNLRDAHHGQVHDLTTSQGIGVPVVRSWIRDALTVTMEASDAGKLGGVAEKMAETIFHDILTGPLIVGDIDRGLILRRLLEEAGYLIIKKTP